MLVARNNPVSTAGLLLECELDKSDTNETEMRKEHGGDYRWLEIRRAGEDGILDANCFCLDDITVKINSCLAFAGLSCVKPPVQPRKGAVARFVDNVVRPVQTLPTTHTRECSKRK